MQFFSELKTLLSTPQRHHEVFDEAQALSSVGGDREFLSELVGIINAAWPTLLADIREGIAQRNLPAVILTARFAKAAAEHISARRVYTSALQLETAAGKGNLQAVQRASKSLEGEVKILQAVLSTFGNSTGLPRH